jgi:AcrR family transcriptional regulator
MSLCSDIAYSRFPMVAPARKNRPQPRRSPVQGRAHATVEIILEAAAQILSRDGPEAATTNAIAARAGVSVGSLYQYFAGRDALIVELERRHVEAMQRVLQGALTGLQGRPLPEAVGQLVAAIVAAHRVSPRLHQALHQSMALGRLDTVDRFELGLESLVAGALRAHPQLDLADPELTAMVLVRALGGLIRTTLRREPGRLDEPAVAAAMTAMILGTLASAPRA